MSVSLQDLRRAPSQNISKVQLQAFYAVKATQQKQELLEFSKVVSLATTQAEATIAGLQLAVRQMYGSNTDVSQSFRLDAFPSLSVFDSAIMNCLCG